MSCQRPVRLLNYGSWKPISYWGADRADQSSDSLNAWIALRSSCLGMAVWTEILELWIASTIWSWDKIRIGFSIFGTLFGWTRWVWSRSSSSRRGLVTWSWLLLSDCRCRGNDRTRFAIQENHWSLPQAWVPLAHFQWNRAWQTLIGQLLASQSFPSYSQELFRLFDL